MTEPNISVFILGFDSRRGLEIFLLTIALGPTQWVPGTRSLGLKWPGCEADHSPPSSAECSYTSTPPIRLHGVVLS
jgi:hypothetical protein